MGNKKKGGAAHKLARMSEEERARYLQHRADIEEEARRRKQQLIAIFMKNKLKREDAFSRLNLAKINQEWRTILRNLKCDELKEEIRVLEHYFADALSRKERTIERLLLELDGCEEQYAKMLAAHVRNVNTLIAVHAERADFWRDGYLAQKKVLLNDYHREMASYRERKLGGYRELECVVHGLEARVERDRKMAADAHSKRVDDVKSKFILQLQTITDDREQQMNGLWSEFQSVLAVYLQHTEQQHDEYVQLRQRDEEDTRIVRFHYAEVLRSTNLIAELKHRLDLYETDQRVHVGELHRYKRILLERQAAAKSSVEEGSKRDREAMRWMVVKSDEAISTIRALVEKGVNILKIGEICHKLETEREQIRLPTTKRDDNVDQNSTNNKSKPTATTSQDVFESNTAAILADMEQFWMRYNNASLDCAILADEKSALKAENRLLKNQLKLYLTTVTIAEGSGGSAEASIRPSSMRVERCVTAKSLGAIRLGPHHSQQQTVRRQRPVTCIEGNLSQAVRSRSLVESKVRMPDVYALVNN